MTRQTVRPTLRHALLAPAALAFALAAQADGPRLATSLLQAYVQECGACHTAYAPGLLPARSWQRLTGRLDRHFGSDASLDAATLGALNGWLVQHAARTGRALDEPPQDRITRSAWFVREHRHIEPAVWALPSVKSAAQCAACHRGADRGRFDEHELIEPAGLDPRQRRAWRD